MSKSQNRQELKQTLQGLERQDLEDVVKVQQYVVGVTMGQHSFQHPGSPRIHQGSRYMPNQTEITFTQQSRSTLYSNFFRFVVVGSFTPYLTLRLVSIFQKRIIPTQRYIIWSALGGGFGGMYGMTLGRMAIARDYLRLENSPLATEARYQLWKINPAHPFLKGFEHETVDWNEYNYRETDSSFHDEQKHYNYDDYNESHSFDDTDRNRSRSQGRNDMDEMNENMRRKKRDRFYSGRNRVNNTSFDDAYDENMDDFFESKTDINPNDDVNDFFEGDSKQKWN